MRVFTTLGARLVLTAVALVAVVALLIGTTTTLVMRDYLTGQLDQKVQSAAERAVGPWRQGGTPGSAPGGYVGGPGIGNQGPGTIVAFPDYDAGRMLTERRSEDDDLDTDELDALEDVPTDGEVHEVELPGHGRYRVAAVDTDLGPLVVGLPTEDVDETIASLIRAEILLALLGMVLATVIGLGLVRRQLKPLREVAATAHNVAALPLAEGAVGLTERVPPHLTDEQTEVGQVGAALNSLLSHVEVSLDMRHRSEQRVRQFVADASHELRTPLTTIAGYTELARKRPDDPEATATALAKVEEEAARMTELVQDLLLLARLDSGRPLDRQPVDLTHLLLEAVSDAQVLAPRHHWRLDLPDEALEVTGDAQRLHQVVTNLLTNARKYTPDGTTVTITARPGGFTVHDDGPGFPPDLVDVAFERFARGDASRHREHGEGGVGLGLSLVRAIVAAHGGSVTLRSEPGDTRIDVSLGEVAVGLDTARIV